MIFESVSVIVPVYNAAAYLAETLASALAQTRAAQEVIVVDDGSTDGSAALAHAFGSPVRVLTQANLGPAAARNLGAAHAAGDLLAFLDADDLWLPDKLARQALALQSNSTYEAALGAMENFVSPEMDGTQRASLARSASQTGTHHVGTMLIRRAAFERIGAFDERWRHGEFIEWWARASRLGLCHVVLPDLVLRRRLHADNLTRRERDGRQSYPALLREHIAGLRKRAGSTLD